MKKFSNILIANRGEIAVRVIKTAKALGYKTTAIYSEADTAAPHVGLADNAVLIGPAPVQQSYLDMDKVLAAAKRAGADAIHPGYGFLSENAEFAKACAAAGIVFIGPSADAIDLMGNKAAAKRRMIDAGVPCVPGYEGRDQSDEVLLNEGELIGFPLMVKAAAGGGGRGMRLVHARKDLGAALKSARSEALNAFGSEELILEKAILQPRHVEIQVFADAHGNVIHLGERDCSVQRRHQKVVEEAPCPVMTEELRDRMGSAAVEAARSINYLGAGTVEFLLDAAGNFYFLEMNTRLQVEHPVTELVTGLDLVELQLRVANGDPLGLDQSDINLTGHAIEVRLYAEDPSEDFLPCAGDIALWQPATSPGLRIDSGITNGQAISPFYDPMLAKVIAYGSNREEAIAKLIQGLEETVLFGFATNTSFLLDILRRDKFRQGEATTAFIAEEFTEDDLKAPVPSISELAASAVLTYEQERNMAKAMSLDVPEGLLNWSSGGLLQSNYAFSFGGIRTAVTVAPANADHYSVFVDQEKIPVKVLSRGEHNYRVEADGTRLDVAFAAAGPGQMHVAISGKTYLFSDDLKAQASGEAAKSSGTVLAPMHGTLLEVFVAEGDTVQVGDRLAVLEAMKMQHDILAEVEGTLQTVLATKGAQAAADDLLFEIAEQA
ncbi:acetyl-CoA carboxylase biotin carboxylase subunit [Sneathiella limimaris]|uniref:acetyl-CoA carboxylase biotin carboxylase subunit n=1 Tax=Sneathiella limimaris TaxID=1964213 RepID=UPI00146C7A6E|nr:acetyl-CoA carboxylase biotin carboxylase subunit [Sneathiella limimaris]